MIHFSPWQYDSVIQGAVSWAGTSDQNRGILWSDTPADADGVAFKAYMPDGTYTMKMVGTTKSNQGIVKIKIDGITVSTWDKYAAGETNNAVKTETGIIIENAGVKEIRVVVDGKNGSSSGYQNTWNYIAFYQTA